MDVFVSYSDKDTEFIQKMCAILRSHGISYWAAYENPGDSNTTETVNRICDAGVLLVFVSKNSNLSKHVINEINCASMYNKPILPVIIDDVEISHAFEYYIAGTNRLYYSQSADFIAPFINMIRSMIGGSASLPSDKSTEHTTAVSTYKDKTDDRKIKKTPIIITLIVALLAVATAVAIVLLKQNKKPDSDSESVTDTATVTASEPATNPEFTTGYPIATFPNADIVIRDFLTEQDNTETVTEDTETTTDKAVTTNTTTAATTNKTTKPTTAKPATTAKKPTTTTTKAPVSKPSAKPTGKDLLIGEWDSEIPIDNLSIHLTYTFKSDGTVNIDLTKANYNEFMMIITKTAVDGLTDKEIAEQGFTNRKEAIDAYFEVVTQGKPYEEVRSVYKKSGQWTLNGDTLTLQIVGYYPVVIETGLSEGKTSFTATGDSEKMIFTKIN